MNIYFTLPVKTIRAIGKDLAGIKKDIDTIRQPPEVKKILHLVKDKIIERFKIFEEEINKEEFSNDDTYVLMDFSYHPLNIKYVNYSDGLVLKMKGSFTDDDLVFLERFGGIR